MPKLRASFGPVKPSQTKSNLSEGEIGRNWTRRCRKRAAEHRMVKPHQTGSSLGFVPRKQVTDRRRRNKLRAARCAGCLALPSQVKPSPTKSNQIKPVRGRNWLKLDSAVTKETAEHRMVKPHQTESNPGFVPRNRVTAGRRRNKLRAARCAGSQNKLRAARCAGCLALRFRVKPDQTITGVFNRWRQFARLGEPILPFIL